MSSITIIVALYISGSIAQGALKEIGKELWLKLKSLFASREEEELITKLLEDPKNKELLEMIMEELEAKLRSSELNRSEFSKLIKEFEEHTGNTVIQSDGAVVGNKINATGDVTISTSQSSENH